MLKTSFLTIRKYTEADNDRLKQLYYNIRINTFHWINSDWFTVDDFERDTRGEEIWVAVINDEIAGFVAVWMPDCFVHHLYVAKAHQRKGIGRALLAQAGRSCTKPMSLKCLSRNFIALNFYKSLGWKVQASDTDNFGNYYLMIEGEA